ncbi:MAG: PEP-CTERM sorting domain-containing protein [Phycisphaerales bacterium]|nr:PEP-CTERM sorting domain-containing protein [Phycisphaerales bacterium]
MNRNGTAARTMEALVLGAIILSSATSVSADPNYVLDDGSGAYNIGPSQFDAQLLWGNYFDATPGAETITEISVSLSTSVPVGAPISILLFDDPTDDLDPTDADLLARTDTITVAPAFNEFQTFDIPDAAVSGGFFVAVMMDLQQGQIAAHMDDSNDLGRSWLFFDGEINLDDLGSSPLYYNMASTPFNGTWMIRATGVPEPSSIAIMLLGLHILIRRQNHRW